jgi:hypothetical protein
MPMTLLLILGAAAHERHVALAVQFPDQSERERLPVVLDRPALPTPILPQW